MHARVSHLDKKFTAFDLSELLVLLSLREFFNIYFYEQLARVSVKIKRRAGDDRFYEPEKPLKFC